MYASRIATSGDSCDKCKKPMNPEQPGMIFRESSRSGQNMIFLHLSCAQKEISRIYKQAKEMLCEVEVKP